MKINQQTKTEEDAAATEFCTTTIASFKVTTITVLRIFNFLGFSNQLNLPKKCRKTQVKS
jgi:hypothetical protein